MGFPIVALFAIPIVSSWLVLQFSRDAKLKRKVCYWGEVIWSILFYLFVVWKTWDIGGIVVIWVILPFVLMFLVWFNHDTIQFCDNCGATLYKTLYYEADYCSECGVKMPKKSAGENDSLDT